MSVRKCPHGIDVGPLDDYGIPEGESVTSTYCWHCAGCPEAGPNEPFYENRPGLSRPRWIVGRQWLGLNVSGYYVSLRGPSHKPLFSERLRKRCRVIPLAFGWRIVVREAGGPLGT